MGISFSFFLRIGFEIDQDIINKHFTVEVPGTFHYTEEQFFDPKTGEKLPIKRTKVWDQRPESHMMINGERLEDDEDICDALANLLDCNVSLTGSYSEGDLQYNFCPKLYYKKVQAIDYGKVSLHNHSIPVSSLEGIETKLEILENKLVKWGFKVSAAKVYIASSIG